MSEKAMIIAALQANKEHQRALKLYIERLETELKSVDRMVEDLDSGDETEDVSGSGLIYVEGAIKPLSVVLPRALLSEDSPFFADAQWKKRYDEITAINQMKAKEHDVLKEAVRSENMRMQSLDAQNRNQPIDVRAFPPDHFEENAEGLDWRRVSAKMSSLLPSSTSRTPKECEIRWLGYLHPSINNSPWTPEETQRLRDILDEEGADEPTRNWLDIAKRLGTHRTPIDCMRHGVIRKVHTWSCEADRRLREAVELYGQNNWQLVAMTVSEDATAHQCQKRYLDSLDPSIKLGPWTTEEDNQLRCAIIAFAGESALGEDSKPPGRQGIPWQDVALFVPGRTNNQCREHQDHPVKAKRKGAQGKKSKPSVREKGKRKTARLDDEEVDEETEEAGSDESAGVAGDDTTTKGEGKGTPWATFDRPLKKNTRGAKARTETSNKKRGTPVPRAKEPETDLRT